LFWWGGGVGELDFDIGVVGVGELGLGDPGEEEGGGGDVGGGGRR